MRSRCEEEDGYEEEEKEGFEEEERVGSGGEDV